MKKDQKAYQLILEVGLMRRLKVLAAKTDRTIKDLIVEAILRLMDELEDEGVKG